MFVQGPSGEQPMSAGDSVHTVQTIFILLLVVVAVFAAMARRLRVPYPIMLAIAGPDHQLCAACSARSSESRSCVFDHSPALVICGGLANELEGVSSQSAHGFDVGHRPRDLHGLGCGGVGVSRHPRPELEVGVRAGTGGGNHGRDFSPEARIQVVSGWNTTNFVLTGIVFVLIELQLLYMMAEIHEYSHRTLTLTRDSTPEQVCNRQSKY